MIRLPALLVLLGLTLLACGDTPGDVLPNPRDGRSGLQLTGQIDGRPIALSDGLPRLNTTDCDVQDGPDDDVCIITRDIDGTLVIVVFENPAVLVEGTTIDVGVGDCATPSACDEVTDMAIIEIQYGQGSRIRAVSGRLTVDVAVPHERYRGDFRIRLPDGSHLRGIFDVVPRPDEIS